MNVPLIGVGGCEDAIVLQAARCNNPGKLYKAPGKPCTAQCGENLYMGSERFEKIARGILAEMVYVLRNNVYG